MHGQYNELGYGVQPASFQGSLLVPKDHVAQQEVEKYAASPPAPQTGRELP